MRERGTRVLSLPLEDIERRQLSTSQEEGPQRELDLLAP